MGLRLKLLIAVLSIFIAASAFAQGGSSPTIITNQKTDCSGQISRGLLCYDTDDDIVYVGTGSTVQNIGTGTSAGTPTLNSVVTAGNTYSGAVSSGTALTVTDGGGTPKGCRIYVDSGSPVVECFDGSTKLTFDIAVYSGQTFDITVDNGGTQANCWRVDDTGKLLALSNESCGTIQSTVNAAGALTLNLNGGTSETLLIRAQQGTGAASINIVSTAGGITLNASGNVTVTNNLVVGGTSTLTGNVTIGDGSQANRTLTAAVTGTDPVVTFSASLVDLSAQAVTLGSVTQNGTVTYGASGKALVSASFDAGALAVDATNCTKTEETIKSWPNTPTVTCADSNSSIMYIKFQMPTNWDAGDVNLSLCVYSANAQGTTETIAFDPVCKCVRDGDQLVVPPSQVTTDQFTFDMANQTDDVQCGTSPAITPAATCAAGAQLWCSIYVDATAWDETPASDIKIVTGRLDAYLATSR